MQPQGTQSRQESRYVHDIGILALVGNGRSRSRSRVASSGLGGDQTRGSDSPSSSKRRIGGGGLPRGDGSGSPLPGTMPQEGAMQSPVALRGRLDTEGYLRPLEETKDSPRWKTAHVDASDGASASEGKGTDGSQGGASASQGGVGPEDSLQSLGSGIAGFAVEDGDESDSKVSSIAGGARGRASAGRSSLHAGMSGSGRVVAPSPLRTRTLSAPVTAMPEAGVRVNASRTQANGALGIIRETQSLALDTGSAASRATMPGQPSPSMSPATRQRWTGSSRRQGKGQLSSWEARRSGIKQKEAEPSPSQLKAKSMMALVDEGIPIGMAIRLASDRPKTQLAVKRIKKTGKGLIAAVEKQLSRGIGLDEDENSEDEKIGDGIGRRKSTASRGNRSRASSRGSSRRGSMHSRRSRLRTLQSGDEASVSGSDRDSEDSSDDAKPSSSSSDSEGSDGGGSASSSSSALAGGGSATGEASSAKATAKELLQQAEEEKLERTLAKGRQALGIAGPNPRRRSAKLLVSPAVERAKQHMQMSTDAADRQRMKKAVAMAAARIPEWDQRADPVLKLSAYHKQQLKLRESTFTSSSELASGERAIRRMFVKLMKTFGLEHHETERARVMLTKIYIAQRKISEADQLRDNPEGHIKTLERALAHYDKAKKRAARTDKIGTMLTKALLTSAFTSTSGSKSGTGGAKSAGIRGRHGRVGPSNRAPGGSTKVLRAQSSLAGSTALSAGMRELTQSQQVDPALRRVVLRPQTGALVSDLVE